MHKAVITVIGAGSVNWMSQLMRDIYMEDELCGGEIRLVDPNEEYMKAVADMLMMFNKTRNKDYAVKMVKNRREALDGADFVLTTFSPGSLKAYRVDLELPVKYGIQVPVSMTTGIPGISSALRTLPVAAEIVRDMEDMCPSAWLLNVTNPMTMVTQAMNAAAKNVKVVGLCHEFHGFGDYIIPMLGLERPEGVHVSDILYKWLGEQGFEYTVAGINHFIWITEAKYKGVDFLPKIREFCRDYKSLNDYKASVGLPPAEEDPFVSVGEVKFAMCRQLGYFPMVGDRHLVEFLPSLCNTRNGYARKYNVQKTTVDHRLSLQAARFEMIKEIAAGRQDIAWEKSSEEISAIMLAVLNKKSVTGIVNLPNQGQISNMPMGSVVETFATIDHNGAKPKISGELPNSIGTLCRFHNDVYQLTYDAAMNGDRDKLIEAMSLDMSNGGADFGEIPALANELLEKNRELLPRFFA